MGADLYLRSINDKARAEWEPKFNAAVDKRDNLPKTAAQAVQDAAQAAVTEAYDAMHGADGYFRDSYNATNFGWMMGFSWWKDVVPLCDKEGNLGGDNLKTFRAMVDKPITDEMLIERQKKLTRNTVEELREFYERDKTNLLALIDKAISLNEPIYASL